MKKIIITFISGMLLISSPAFSQKTGNQQGGQMTNRSPHPLDPLSGQAPGKTSQLVNSSAQNMNPLEQALDFEIGTKAIYTDWADDGGLNRLNSWHGLDLRALELQWGADGHPKFVAIVPSQLTSIKEMRSALSKACGIKEDQWDREDMQGRTTAKAAGTKCRAEFNNWFRGPGIWNINLYKNKD